MSGIIQKLSDQTASEAWRGFENIYGNFGPPLTPSDEDRRFVEAAIADWVACHPGERLRAVLLGVTPGIVAAGWPGGSFLIAVERSKAIIRSVWPGNIPAVRWAVEGDWLSLPVRAGTLDIAVGDGSLSALSYPGGYRRLARAFREKLRPGGILVLRAYVPPAAPEDPRHVMAELPRHATFHQFKLRLLMALQESPEEGTHLAEVYRYWSAYGIDRAALAAETRWRREEIDTIDRYRDLDGTYTFPPLDELRALLGESFSQMRVLVPSYPLGECCPTLVMRP
jgi:SAM-dependent methyltransferase